MTTTTTSSTKGTTSTRNTSDATRNKNDTHTRTTTTNTKTTRMGRTIRTPHPFTRTSNPTPREISYMIVGVLFGIVQLRLFLLLLVVIIGGSTTIFLHYCALYLKKWKRYNSNNFPRVWTVLTLRCSCRLLLFIGGFYSIDVVGRGTSTVPDDKKQQQQPQKQPPKIIVSNHLSNIEILHLLTLPFHCSKGHPCLPVFVTKESVFHLPFIGIITRDVLGSIGVSRKKKQTCANINTNTNDIHNGTGNGNSNGNGNGNGNGNDNLVEQIMERVHNDNNNASQGHGPIVIFPEGTTTNGTCLLNFKKGAFVPLVDVLPICYSFSTTTTTTTNDRNKNKKSSSSSSFIPTYESIWTPIYLWRLLCQPINTLKCEILPQISPPPQTSTSTLLSSTTALSLEIQQQEQEQSRIELFISMVRQQMAATLQIPVINNKGMNYHHKVHYHQLLRARYNTHPWGAIYAMCFQPMQKVLVPVVSSSMSTTIEKESQTSVIPNQQQQQQQQSNGMVGDENNDYNKDAENAVNHSCSYEYDTVIGTTVVACCSPTISEEENSNSNTTIKGDTNDEYYEQHNIYEHHHPNNNQMVPTDINKKKK